MDWLTTYAWYVLAGALVGMLIGALGVGGGSVMTPLLIQVFRFSPTAAVVIDLFYALCTKIFAISLHRRQQGLENRVVMWVGGFGVLGAVIGSILFSYGSRHFSTGFDQFIRLLIGVTLIAGALVNVLMRFYRKSDIQLLHGRRMMAGSMAVVGLFTGVLVSLTSIGAGAVVMVFLLHFWRIQLDRVVGTDLAIAVIIIAVASFSHALVEPINFPVTLALIAGGLIGVFIGEQFHRRIEKEKLKLILTVLLAIIGVRMILQ